MTIDGVSRGRCRDAVPRRRDAEPDRVRGHLSAARGAARPLPLQGRRRLPRRGGRAGDPRAAPPRRRAGDARRRPAGRRPGRAARRRAREVDATGVSRRGGRLRVGDRARGRATLPSVELGASPRAGVHLLAAAKARGAARRARLRHARRRRRGRSRVLRHRLVLRPEAELERYRPDDAIRAALAEPCPSRGDARRRAHARSRSPSSRCRGARSCRPGWPLLAALAIVVGERRRRARRARRRRRSTRGRRAALVRAAAVAGSGRAGRAGAAAACGCGSRSAPDLRLEPQARRTARLDARLVARRRGRHVAAGAGRARVDGPLGLGALDHRGRRGGRGRSSTPTCPARAGSRQRPRSGRFREEGRRTRGPLGLGTDFESVRDYSPDDDIRQVNWRATARLGRPMSNQYRVERDRDVICLVDCGRLMAAPLGDATRLDVALDAAVAVAAVADELGDRCGAIAFDGEVRRSVAPRRARRRDVVHGAVRPRAGAPSTATTSARSSSVARREARVRARLHRPDRASRPRGRCVEALPVLARAPRRRRRERRRPRSRARSRTRAAGGRSTSTGRPWRSTFSTRGPASRRAAAARGRRGRSRRAPERSRAACVRAYLRAKARARLC